MGLHVIVGAGAVGSSAARLLAERGERVRIVSRRGTGPDHPQVERVAADATDAQRLTDLATGAEVLYNCLNPLYHRWATDWPPLSSGLLAAAEQTGAVLATVGNLYPYGPVDGPITPETPLAAQHPKLRLRGEMWRTAKRLHDAGRIRTTEVRGSDYIEANSIFTFVLREPLLAGRRAYVPAPLDVPHSWTLISDVARTLVTVANDPRGYGEAWLVPTNPPLTVRELAARFTRVAGIPAAKLTALPYAALWLAGLRDPFVRELRITRYQFTRPFVLDSSRTERTFGLAPSDLDAALKSLVAAGQPA